MFVFKQQFVSTWILSILFVYLNLLLLLGVAVVRKTNNHVGISRDQSYKLSVNICICSHRCHSHNSHSHNRMPCKCREMWQFFFSVLPWRCRSSVIKSNKIKPQLNGSLVTCSFLSTVSPPSHLSPHSACVRKREKAILPFCHSLQSTLTLRSEWHSITMTISFKWYSVNENRISHGALSVRVIRSDSTVLFFFIFFFFRNANE